MTEQSTAELIMPEDGYEEYYRRKLWEMIPGVYRQEAGDDTLDTLLSLIARQAAQLRRRQDRLWENQSVEYADSWVLPYLADLVDTRLVSEFNPRGRRTDVAKTIYYRRRAGTPGVLEELIRDIAGWQGRLVESFRTLLRTPHRLDGPLRSPPAHHLSTTPSGGLVDLRDSHLSTRVGAPFDEAHYLPDFRPHSGANGRRNIPKVAFHLYRLEVFEIEGATPAQLESADDSILYTFDPSGRDLPLYSPGNARASEDGESPWTVPAPLSCRDLNHGRFRITDQTIEALWALGESEGLDVPAELYEKLYKLRRAEARFQNRDQLRRMVSLYSGLHPETDLGVDAVFRRLEELALEEGCGRAFLTSGRLLGMEREGEALSLFRVAGAGLEDLDSIPTDDFMEAFVDPERGRLTLGEEIPEAVTYHYAVPGRVGAGPWPRPQAQLGTPDLRVNQGNLSGPLPSHGLIQFDDNKTYQLGFEVEVDGTLTVQAANGKRPFVDVTQGATFRGSGSNNRLILDGLWFAALDDSAPAFVIKDGFKEIVLRNCTFDPGGSIASLKLQVDDAVESLRIESSILGALEVSGAQAVGEIRVTDSALVAPTTEDYALRVAAGATVHLEAVTLVGKSDLPQLHASNSILAGEITVQNHQTGCVRFSAAPEHSELPQPYRVHWLTEDSPLFISLQFGNPYFLRLRDHAPQEVRGQAEYEMEMGVYHSRFDAARFRDLLAKIEEYLPFGQIPIFINET